MSTLKYLSGHHTHALTLRGRNPIHLRLRSPPIVAVAALAPPSIKARKTHSMPPEKAEIFKSLEGWATQNVLPLLKPVEQCWQPLDFLPDSSLPYDEFSDQVKALRDRTVELPEEYLVVLVGNTITEEALPTYQTMFKFTGRGQGRDGASPSPWAQWTRMWTAEENQKTSSIAI